MATDLSDRVAVSAEGNPLFVEELVRMLIDERHLRQDASALPMPPTIQAVLAARLDRLDSAELAIVKAGAVIGKSFSDEAALLLAGRRDRSELESHLGALVRKQIIEADGGRFGGRRTFSFKHILMRDVAYQGILKAQRADLHERYADWLEGQAGEPPASTRRSSDTTSRVPSATSPSWRRWTIGDASWPLALLATWARPVPAPSREATSARPSACSSEPCRCFRTMSPPAATSRQAGDRPG